MGITKKEKMLKSEIRKKLEKFWIQNERNRSSHACCVPSKKESSWVSSSYPIEKATNDIFNIIKKDVM